jgi:uncharacterized protein YhaN
MVSIIQAFHSSNTNADPNIAITITYDETESIRTIVSDYDDQIDKIQTSIEELHLRICHSLSKWQILAASENRIIQKWLATLMTETIDPRQYPEQTIKPTEIVAEVEKTKTTINELQIRLSKVKSEKDIYVKTTIDPIRSAVNEMIRRTFLPQCKRCQSFTGIPVKRLIPCATIDSATGIPSCLGGFNLCLKCARECAGLTKSRQTQFQIKCLDCGTNSQRASNAASAYQINYPTMLLIDQQLADESEEFRKIFKVPLNSVDCICGMEFGSLSDKHLHMRGAPGHIPCAESSVPCTGCRKMFQRKYLIDDRCKNC